MYPLLDLRSPPESYVTGVYSHVGFSTDPLAQQVRYHYPFEPRTSNLKPQTSNLKYRILNIEYASAPKYQYSPFFTQDDHVFIAIIAMD